MWERTIKISLKSYLDEILKDCLPIIEFGGFIRQGILLDFPNFEANLCWKLIFLKLRKTKSCYTSFLLFSKKSIQKLRA